MMAYDHGGRLNGLWQFHLLKERILNAVSKNPESRSYGCCDRHYWGWKIRDFPDMTLQYSILPFGKLLDRNSKFEIDLFKAMIRFWVCNINKDGSADQVFPGERSIGPTLYGLSALLSSFDLISELSSEKERRVIEESIKTSLRFALANPETYGHVGNHKALYAYCFLLAYQLFADRCFKDAYYQEIRDLFAKFTDGWFFEYETADPAYQTQCLHYLTLCYQIEQNNEIERKVLEGIEEFCAYFVFPDKSYSGLFSGRATELFYPYPFFYWAEKNKRCGQIVSFLYGEEKNGLTKWYALDYENAIRLGTNYLLSFALYRDSRFRKEISELPCLGQITKKWDTAGLIALSDPYKHAVINLKRGGIFKLVGKLSEKQIQDTGYVIEYRGKKYTNAIYWDMALLEMSTDGRYSVQTSFCLIRDDYLDSTKLTVLRFLGMTVFRAAGATNCVKKAMIKSLFLKKEAAPFTFQRTIRDQGKLLHIEDIIMPRGTDTPFTCALTIRLLPFHMACAGYYSGEGNTGMEEYGFGKRDFAGVSKIVTNIDLSSDPIAIKREFVCSRF